jgi:DNA processing protein
MDREDLILLNLAGIGKKKLEKFSKGELSERLKGLKRQSEKALEAELKLARRHNVEIVTIIDRAYPRVLKEIYDPPLVLYVKGKILKEGELAIALVGSRLASIYGLSTAERLGYELASKGVVIVSGLARGIDSAAHKGAIEAYGRTIAVLGNGLGTVYPPENKRFADEIVEKEGAVISEFPMGTEPLARNFPQRNRIISGLSLAVVVVEAAKKSGALITADFALEQGKEVFAVPGKVDSTTSFGTNELIKQGARLVQTAEDVVEELGLRFKEAKTKGKGAKDKKAALKPVLSPEEEVIYKNLSKEPRYLDDVVETAKFPLSKTAQLLLKLQLKKLVKELPGKNFVKM